MSENDKNVTTGGKPAQTPEKKKKPSLFSRITKWFKDLKSETKKITWPTFNQVVNNTIVVLVTVLGVGIVIWIFDFLLGQGTSLLRGLFM